MCNPTIFKFFGLGQAQTEEWVQSVKGTAKEAQDKTIAAAQSTSDSAQEGKNQTAGFLHEVRFRSITHQPLDFVY